VVQARTLWLLALLIEAHEEQASDAERRGDVEQVMGWFADAMRLRDVIQVLTSIADRPSRPSRRQRAGRPPRRSPGLGRSAGGLRFEAIGRGC
jgi:hypothetical protein